MYERSHRGQVRSTGVSRVKCNWVSLGCLLFPLSPAFAAFPSDLRARRGFLDGVFCSVGRSVNGRFRLAGGGEVSSEVGEEGRNVLTLEERVLYVLRRSAGIVLRIGQ